MNNPSEKIKNAVKTVGKKTMNMAAGIAAVTGVAANTPEEPNLADLDNKNTIENTLSSENTENIAEDKETYSLTAEDLSEATKTAEEENLENEIDLDKILESDKEGEKTMEEFRLDLINYFEQGSAEISESAVESIKKELSDFLENLPQEIKDRIKTITVYTGSNKDKIIAPYATSGYNIENNYDLSEARGKELMKILEPELPRYDLGHVQLEISIPKGDKNREAGVSENNKRYASIGIEDSIRTELDAGGMESSTSTLEEKTNKIEFSADTYAVILDESGSMRAETAAAREKISEINAEYETEIKEITLKGGSMEAHLETLRGVIDNINGSSETTKKIYVLTDEFDSTYSKVHAPDTKRREQGVGDYKYIMKKLLEDAKKKNIEIIIYFYNPNEYEGGFKEFSLNDNPYALIPAGKDAGADRFVRQYNDLPDNSENESVQ